MVEQTARRFECHSRNERQGQGQTEHSKRYEPTQSRVAAGAIGPCNDEQNQKQWRGTGGNVETEDKTEPNRTARTTQTGEPRPDRTHEKSGAPDEIENPDCRINKTEHDPGSALEPDKCRPDQHRRHAKSADEKRARERENRRLGEFLRSLLAFQIFDKDQAGTD